MKKLIFCIILFAMEINCYAYVFNPPYTESIPVRDTLHNFHFIDNFLHCAEGDIFKSNVKNN